jgi:hypothetical protein
MAVDSWEQAHAVLQSIGMVDHLDAADEYGQAILDSVRILRTEERPEDVPCPQCHMYIRHKLSCSEPFWDSVRRNRD